MSGRIATQREEFAALGDEVARPRFRARWHLRWWLAFAASLGLLGLFALSLIWILFFGPGVWGNNIPVTWALDIVGYDWWIGIATGGLVVSAWLVLTDAPTRGSFDRLAQAVALLAAAAAGLYPIIHLGRPWFFYWNLPYPNQLDLWPQFRSPLAWDAMAIISFLGVAFCFWFVGLLPDLAILRDRAGGWWWPRVYGVAALGWRGSALHWLRWVQARKLLSVFGLIVVVSLQSGAAVMFSGTVEPGWHDTLLPLTYLAGAMFSGIAAVTLVVVLVRSVFDLPDLITRRHLDLLGLMLLGAGLATTYCYMIDFFNTAYGGSAYELSDMQRRATGTYAWSFWLVVALALLPYNLLWLRSMRRSAAVLALISLSTVCGIYFDHFMLIVVTLHHDFLPSSEHLYVETFWGVSTFLGTMGLFATLLLLALRLMPLLSVTELRDAARIAGHG